jgi:hypothetical protein
MARVPNQPATPIIGFRCPPELRELVERISAERGVSMTEFIVEALWREVRLWPGLDGDGGG